MNKIINKKMPYCNRIMNKSILIETLNQPIKGVPIRGHLTIYDSFISFCQIIKNPQVRNKVVFKSHYFSARITKDLNFSITCHISSKDMADSATKRKVVLQFIKMMSTLETILLTEKLNINEI